MLTYNTREEYLNAFIDASRDTFEAANAPIPMNVRVSVGFPSCGFRSRAIAEVWDDTASQDGHFEIFIKPTIDDVPTLCAALTHELVHCAVGLQHNHDATFRRVATTVGLIGKATEAQAGADWFKWAAPVIDGLGAMPYAAINTGVSSAKPKQNTYNRKVECNACGWIARVTTKHIAPHSHLNCPVPDCIGELIQEETETED